MTKQTTAQQLQKRLFLRSRRRKLRSLRRFSEEEIRIPSGPYVGRKLKCPRQPFFGLFFDEVDSGRWRRFAVTGCVQSGKTLSILAVLMWHLFEHGEDVIFAVPKKKLAHYKWKKDIEPIIRRTRYKSLIPTTGHGSRGGDFESITFTNGATLIFMSGSGADEERSSITSRVLVATEVDKYDEPGEVSQESDPITQLEARTKAYGENARVYLECTVSDVRGRIWREFQQGSASEIWMPCDHCPEPKYVKLEREHLYGWEEATSIVEAREKSHFACPECGIFWDDKYRIDAMRRAVLVHEGQQVDVHHGFPRITGDAKATDTLGFRWHAAHNLFETAGIIGADEWLAHRSENPLDAERGRKQFTWTIPDELGSTELIPLKNYEVAERRSVCKRATVPENCKWLVSGCDVGKWLLHWVLMSIAPDGSPHTVDYGRIDVASDDLGIELAITKALGEYKETLEGGFTQVVTGQNLIPIQAWIDSRYQQDTVIKFCRESGDRFNPVEGYGIGQVDAKTYKHPLQTNKAIVILGDHYYCRYVRDLGVCIFHADANYWKSYVHSRLRADPGEPGAMTLFDAPPREHLSYTSHLTNERQVQTFKPGHGLVTQWEAVSKNNHWLDATWIALTAGHYCGARIIKPQEPAVTSEQFKEVESSVLTPDGRQFFITER